MLRCLQCWKISWSRIGLRVILGKRVRRAFGSFCHLKKWGWFSMKEKGFGRYMENWKGKPGEADFLFLSFRKKVWFREVVISCLPFWNSFKQEIKFSFYLKVFCKPYWPTRQQDFEKEIIPTYPKQPFTLKLPSFARESATPFHGGKGAFLGDPLRFRYGGTSRVWSPRSPLVMHSIGANLLLDFVL